MVRLDQFPLSVANLCSITLFASSEHLHYVRVRRVYDHLILRRGAHRDALSPDGKTMFHMALEQKRLEI